MRSKAVVVSWSMLGLIGLFGCGGDAENGAAGNGGDGGSGGTGGAGTSLQLLQTTPADMASEVSTDVVVTAEFDAALNEATVTTSSFRLTRGDGADVEGTVEVDGTIATYRTAEELGLLGSYTVTLTTGIESVSGDALEASQTWSFSTRDGAWLDTPDLIEFDDSEDASDPQVGVSADGGAVAVWGQREGDRIAVRANRFEAGPGWLGVEPVDGEATGSATDHQVDVGADGSAVAIWSGFEGDGLDARGHIWANRFAANTGWSGASLLEVNDMDTARFPHVAVDPAGNAVAVWIQFENRLNVWGNRFMPGSGWMAAELVETNDGGASNPRVAIDPSGTAVAVWAQSDGTRSNIWANRFTPGEGWRTAELVEINNAGSASNPHVSMDSNGNAVAVWTQSDGIRSNVWANRFTPNEGWSTAALIEMVSGNAGAARVTVNPGGNALAIWTLSDGARFNIWANRFTPTEGWGTAELIEMGAGDANNPQVAVDPNGNGLAVWQQSDGQRTSIWANRFNATSGWGTAELIEINNAGDAENPQVALSPRGTAVAVWEQSDGTRVSIWSSRFE